jgi:type I restriction enzyme S subunit
MKKWPSIRLGEVCDVLDYMRRPISKIDRISGPYPYYGATGIQDYVADFLFDEPLILVGEDGAKWGACETCAFSVDGKYWVNNHAHVLKPDRTKLLDNWLINYLNFADLSESVSGATVQKLNQANLRAIEVPCPPTTEQALITFSLDSQLATIEEARQAAQRRVKAAEALEAALFREVFQGITPVVIGPPLEPAPAGWSWQRLSTLADLESGHTPSRRQPSWWDGDIPWIALPDIRALDGKVAMETKGYTNPDGIKNSSARILPKDTVVFGRDVQVGFTTIMGRPMATSQHFFNWICASDLAPRFLMQALRASKTYMETKSSGAIHQTIYMPAAREFHVCLPTRKQQDQLTTQLDARLTAATEILIAARAELKAIQSLPAAALRRVFS